jgi:hydrogenase-4 component E
VVDPVFLRILGVCGALFLLAALAILVARQMRGCIRLYAGQSFLLAVLAALMGFLTGSGHLYLVAALTLVVKTLLIPYLLGWVIHDTILEKREIEFVVNIPGSLLISGLLAALAFFTSKAVIFPGDVLTGLLLPLGTAVTLIGLYIMVSRKEAVPQVTGLLVTENGVLLVAVPTAFGLPLIAEFGLFFDLLVGALLMGVLVMRLHKETESTTVHELCQLKE